MAGATVYILTPEVERCNIAYLTLEATESFGVKGHKL